MVIYVFTVSHAPLLGCDILVVSIDKLHTRYQLFSVKNSDFPQKSAIFKFYWDIAETLNFV